MFKLESIRHIQAFEYYYSLGETRTYNEVSKKFKVCLNSVNRWGKNFKWQKRVEERNRAITKKLTKITDKGIIKEARIVLQTKIEARLLIEKYIKIIDKSLSGILRKDEVTGEESLGVQITNTTDIEKMISALEKLTKLDMQLADELKDNEQSGNKPITIQFIQNNIGDEIKELKKKIEVKGKEVK